VTIYVLCLKYILIWLMVMTVFLDTVILDILVKLLYAVFKKQYSVFLIPDVFLNREMYFH